MAYQDLREFVQKLEKEGELKRIRAEVDPILEITEITQRVARDKNRLPESVGPALLFEKPKGSRVPLLVNTFGSVRRMAMAFEVRALDEVAATDSRVSWPWRLLRDCSTKLRCCRSWRSWDLFSRRT